MGTMNVSRDTKAFGNTVGEMKSSNDQVKTLSARDIEKVGGEDMGAVLNKVADKNYIDPSKKMRAVGNSQLDKDAFFKLMLAQMKNQDPTNPMKSHEMAAQLANFSSLEQMQNMNGTLTEMKNSAKPAEQFQALSLIGRSGAGDSTDVVRTKDDRDHDFKFEIPTEANVTVRIKNPDGAIIRTYELNNLKKGDNSLTWNGQDETGRVVPAGNYQFLAEAKSAQGQKIAVKTAFDGLITGVNFTSEGPVLMVGKQTVRLRDVKKITDPKLGDQQNDQNIEQPVQPDLKSMNGEAQNKEKAGAPAANPQANLGQIMGQVGMSSEMMAKVAKEAK
ncbi:MAG: flagellar hook assembly protein FlgD [Pseudobdellovibrionaceae bacterium]